MDQQYDFGMIGLGVMGRNLLLNMADHGFAVAGLDTDKEKVSALHAEASEMHVVKGTTDSKEFVSMLKTPRAIMMLVPAGKIVDSVIDELLPDLEAGDTIIDGGNSLFSDTDRRVIFLSQKGLYFMGVGVSGGEKGARFGPSIMPGGDPKAYERIRPIFESVAAKVNGEPCVTYLGEHSAGHYVKMVHNGIEYGLMQLISETYDVLKRGFHLKDEAIGSLYEEWNQNELKSFLLEITTEIFSQHDDLTSGLLLNQISDQARQKGTGKWTSQNAMDLQVPLPTVDMAVSIRDISAYKEERQKAAKTYEIFNDQQNHAENGNIDLETLRKGFYAATIAIYAQGMALLLKASKEYHYAYRLADVAKIWRGGCIIRSACLEDIRQAYEKNSRLENILLDESLSRKVIGTHKALRAVVSYAAFSAIPAAAFMSSLAYIDAYRSANLPTNLVQAQRDFFGSHTYERVDQPGTFHTHWNASSTIQ